MYSTIYHSYYVADQHNSLMRPIYFQEMEMVVMSMPKNKALSANGYTSDLFQTC